jgi:tetratricopeptide (TPR) repeat protein/DNA-binding MarR family transcriptional regulator
MTLSQFNLTIEDGILLYLFEYSKYKDDFEVPSEISQRGIADAVGIRRSHASYSLKSLKTKGLVTERIAHVKDIVRQRKVYFLTPEGIENARRIKNNVEQKSILFNQTSGEARTVKISEINKKLKTPISILQLINLTTNDNNLNEQAINDFQKTGKYSGAKKSGNLGPIRFIEHMAQPKRFIGREIQVQQINKWLESELPRIIVIKGIAGIGKTTLAAKIIDNYVQKNTRSLFWYKFHEWDTLRSILTDFAEFLSHIGKEKLKFHLKQKPSIELPEIRRILEAEFEGQKAILVFDDFQKISENLKQFFSMLIEILDLKILENINVMILTRGPTGFYDRREVAINKLVAELELSGLGSKESKQLLNVKDIEDSEFDKIYKITEGHPLTIELIGIHITEKASTGETNRIDSKLNIGELFKDQHDINKYIHEEIFQRLSKPEKKLLGFISVFRYPIQPESLFIDDEIDYETIDNLTMKSLLSETTSGYDLHELIKEFFYRRLTPQAKAQYHNEAANYYSSEVLLDNKKGTIDLPETTNSILESQYHFLQTGKYEASGKLAAKYGEILIGKGFTEEFYALLINLSSERVTKDAWPELLIHKGHILTINGDWEAALDCYQESLEWCEKYEINCSLARAYNAVGVIHFRKGDFEEAMKYYMKGLDVAEPEGDDQNIAKLSSNIALIHWSNGNLDQAIELNKRSLDLSKKMDDKQGIARAHNNLGIIHWEQNNLDFAIEEYKKSLILSEELGDKKTIASLYDNLGEVYRLKGERQIAERYYKKSLELSETLGFKWQIAEVYCNLGILFKEIDDTKSSKHFNAALELYTTLGAKREMEKVKSYIKNK